MFSENDKFLKILFENNKLEYEYMWLIVFVWMYIVGVLVFFLKCVWSCMYV